MDKKIKILLFGNIAETAGSSEIFFPAADDTDTLLQHLKEAIPELCNRKFSVAVNKEIISGNILLNQPDEVALLPPFSGG